MAGGHQTGANLAPGGMGVSRRGVRKVRGGMSGRYGESGRDGDRVKWLDGIAYISCTLSSYISLHHHLALLPRPPPPPPPPPPPRSVVTAVIIVRKIPPQSRLADPSGHPSLGTVQQGTADRLSALYHLFRVRWWATFPPVVVDVP